MNRLLHFIFKGDLICYLIRNRKEIVVTEKNILLKFGSCCGWFVKARFSVYTGATLLRHDSDIHEIKNMT